MLIQVFQLGFQVAFESVPAGVLGAVEGLVGFLDQIDFIMGILREKGAAHADRDFRFVFSVCEKVVADGFHESIGRADRLLSGYFIHDDDELFSAIAKKPIRGTQLAVDDFAQLLQYGIAE